MSNKCPKCQFENTSDSKFCKECATSLFFVSIPFIYFIVFLLSAFIILSIQTRAEILNIREVTLEEVKSFAYNIQNVDSDSQWNELTKSHYDMYILEPCVTEKENKNFNIEGLLESIREYNRIKYDKKPIILAYADVGQAEDWRWYWQEDWEPGNPEWIVTTDPDEWEGNYPVAFWYPEWENIVIYGSGGMSHVEIALQAGFDGIDLDWIEAFSDLNVVAKAEKDGIPDIAEAMLDFIEKMRIFARQSSSNANPNFLIVAQNAPDLFPENPNRYNEIIDAISCEAIWFGGTGGYDDWDDPHGFNVPTNDIYSGWTEELLEYLSLISGLMPIFCVEYAQDFGGEFLASEVYTTLAPSRGFIPYCTRISLSELSKTPYPPAYLEEERNKEAKRKKSYIRR